METEMNKKATEIDVGYRTALRGRSRGQQQHQKSDSGFQEGLSRMAVPLFCIYLSILCVNEAYAFRQMIV